MAQIAGHYFDWEALLNRRLPRLAAYSYGTAMVTIPLAVYFVRSGDRAAALALICTVAASGMAVLGCYALDKFLHTLRRLREVEQREDDLLKRLRDERPA